MNILKFKTFPKVELHLHLDCSLNFQTASQIDSSITKQNYLKRLVAPDKCINLADYLTTTENSVKLLQTEDALRLATTNLLRQLKEDHVIYAEIRFAPLLHTEQGLPAEDVVAIVAEAMLDAQQNTGIEARLLLCTLRHFSEAQSLETVRLVRQFRGAVVAGFDIAANEAGDPIAAHIPAFQYANRHEIPCTAHAGEACGASSVWETLEHFRPRRIGHGVRSIEDPKLLDHLRQQNIHLEICPTSNVQTDIFPTYAEHPIHQLYKAGISLGVNTDARTTTPITLSQEYEKLHKTFGWTHEHFLWCNLQALDAAFLSPIQKAALKQTVRAFYCEL